MLVVRQGPRLMIQRLISIVAPIERKIGHTKTEPLCRLATTMANFTGNSLGFQTEPPKRLAIKVVKQGLNETKHQLVRLLPEPLQMSGLV